MRDLAPNSVVVGGGRSLVELDVVQLDLSDIRVLNLVGHLSLLYLLERFVVEGLRRFVCRRLLDLHLNHARGGCVDSGAKASNVVLVGWHHWHLCAALGARVDERIDLHVLVLVHLVLSLHEHALLQRALLIMLHCQALFGVFDRIRECFDVLQANLTVLVLLVDLVDEAADVDGVGESLGAAAAPRDGRRVGVYNIIICIIILLLAIIILIRRAFHLVTLHAQLLVAVVL